MTQNAFLNFMMKYQTDHRGLLLVMTGYPLHIDLHSSLSDYAAH